MTSKRCKVHYRRLRRDAGLFPADLTLAEAITMALQHDAGCGRILDKARERISSVERAEGYHCLMNDIHVTDQYVFGDLCLFAEGQMQALLRTASGAEDPDNPSLAEVLAAMDIDEARAPTGHEYLHAISYWLVIDDHLYQIQNVALQAKSIEEYLTWLLRDRSGIISGKQSVSLDVKFDRGQIGEDLGDIKSVEIGGLVPETVAAPVDHEPIAKAGGETEVSSTLAERVAAKMEKARKIITELLGDVEADRLIASVPDEASLEVVVNIGYRSKKRKFNKDFMSSLASGLRNIPDGEIKIRGRDGEIRGDDARLSADMNVKRVRPDSSLLDLRDVEAQLLEVHRRFMHDGKISEDEDG